MALGVNRGAICGNEYENDRFPRKAGITEFYLRIRIITDFYRPSWPCKKKEGITLYPGATEESEPRLVLPPFPGPIPAHSLAARSLAPSPFC